MDAKDAGLYEYRATLSRVIDGDTVDLHVDLGHSVRITERYRLLDVWAPELNSTDPAKREAAKQARDFLVMWLHGRPLRVHTVKARASYAEQREGFRRYLARIRDEDTGACVNEELVAAGLATPVKMS